MNTTKTRLIEELAEIKAAGLFKAERVIESQQSAEIQVAGTSVLNFCANNYLGLANHPRLIKAAQNGLAKWGFGLSSVRFICGTQSIHKELEGRIAGFLGLDDAILYSSCFDANGGLFETILGPEDAIISDQLNHASIIDGVRLCKARRYRYANNNMDELESILKESQDARTRLISTDGVFSMDGYVAQIDKICDLAEKYDALVHVDDSHATGFFGPNGRGSYEFRGAMGRVDIITSTLGKAMGGASGGFTAARQEIVDMLRQRSRPYLFSNTLAPAITAASIAVIDLLSESSDLRQKLEENTRYFREKMTAAGFDIKVGEHPIVPIMFGDAKLAADIAAAMLEKGIYVIGFSFPVVPKGEARIRTQISAAHTREHLDRAIQAFTEVGKQFGVI
ncbi:MAG: glycine C-acetyltransferase [Candidatus Marinimicrobia bacterium]|jgi:glycine C-acetyltransferase|nr:glycine C-acetyltransferase [Candidatus Neomarinimicrobiota bacterium]MBT4360866.1 glycine C-acetyltransferase [Candidatus Neomarinimicrobiota bacterium]MBT4715328.1 glycine C-acetyltransferase [Candidatus Neomarinimicrobiota bacterium]MBT4946990.1 glycine C-acetyltransferase [Candidatus Neomarinimicrobiota bacterium]MBT5268381.1 glycine C-acetyltransferase [Candidatus Neomarinimicrobiota bacterium]